MKLIEEYGTIGKVKLNSILWTKEDNTRSLGVVKKEVPVHDLRYWEGETPKGGICLTDQMLANLIIYLNDFLPDFFDKEKDIVSELNEMVYYSGTVGHTTYKIHEKIGTLENDNKSKLMISWTSFNNEDAALDIRTWTQDLTRYTRGIRISVGELDDFFYLLLAILDRNKIKLPNTTPMRRKFSTTEEIFNEFLFKEDLAYLLNDSTSEELIKKIKSQL